MTAPLAAAPAASADVLGADLHLCPHLPPCPPARAADHDAAVVVAVHHDQGWVRLCNGVVVWDDTGELVGTTPVAPHRPEPRHCTNPDHAHCCDKES